MDQEGYSKRLKGAKSEPKWNQKRIKVRQEIFKDTSCGTGSPNGGKINAKTHQKSLPKLVAKKIMEIIKNHVSLEIIQIHLKTNVF